MIPAGLLYFWVLLNLLWCCLCSRSPGVLKCLRKASIYRSLGVGEQHVVKLVDDTCHSLIGGALRLFLQDTWHLLIGRNALIFKVTHVSTQLDCLCYCLHASGCLCNHLHTLMCDWFLHAFYAPISMTLG